MTRPFFLFAHGWGFDAAIWDRVRAALPEADGAVIERGYLGAEPRWPAVRPGSIAVGHSAGLLDLLAGLPPGCAGLVAINGFTRFAAGPDFPHGIPSRLLERMLRRLEADPEPVLAEFRARCGLPGPVASPQPGRLREGLLALAGADARPLLPWPGLRLLALSASRDPIIPVAMTRDCFAPAETVWHPIAGHLLPLTQPDWCARHLRAFAA